MPAISRLRFQIIIAFVTFTPALGQSQTWTAATGGDWNNSTNWSGSFPNGLFDSATFSSSSSSKAINLNTAVRLQSLQFSATQSGDVSIAPGTGGSLQLFSWFGTTLTVNTGSGNHTVSAGITLSGLSSHTWNIGANRTFTTTGAIGGPQGITKTGSGTLLFNGTNTFTGALNVNAGSVGGHGSIASSVTVAAGGSITAGTSPVASVLTLGNGLTLSGQYRVSLFSNSALSQLSVSSGTATLTGGSLALELGSGVTVASFRAAGARSFTVIDAANGQLSGTFATTDFTSAGFAASEWSVTYDTAAGNTILNFTPVPEPFTVLGIGAFGFLGGWAVRRRASSRLAAKAA